MSWVSKFKGSKKTPAASVKSAPRSKPASGQSAPKPQGTARGKLRGSEPGAAQKSQVLELAQAIFRITAAENKTYANREEQLAGWKNSRAQYLRMARKTIRYLEKRGIHLSGTAPEA
jgi:hypothetical protein